MELLVLTLDFNAPKEVQMAWEKFRNLRRADEEAINNFFADVLQNTQCTSNSNMVILNRVEGGLGNQQQGPGREIRMLIDLNYKDWFNEYYFGRYGSVCFELSDDIHAQWSAEQILDISNAIVTAANNKIEEKTTYTDNGLSIYRVKNITQDR